MGDRCGTLAQVQEFCDDSFLPSCLAEVAALIVLQRRFMPRLRVATLVLTLLSADRWVSLARCECCAEWGRRAAPESISLPLGRTCEEGDRAAIRKSTHVQVVRVRRLSTWPNSPRADATVGRWVATLQFTLSRSARPALFTCLVAALILGCATSGSGPISRESKDVWVFAVIDSDNAPIAGKEIKVSYLSKSGITDTTLTSRSDGTVSLIVNKNTTRRALLDLGASEVRVETEYDGLGLVRYHAVSRYQLGSRILALLIRPPVHSYRVQFVDEAGAVLRDVDISAIVTSDLGTSPVEGYVDDEGVWTLDCTAGRIVGNLRPALESTKLEYKASRPGSYEESGSMTVKAYVIPQMSRIGIVDSLEVLPDTNFLLPIDVTDHQGVPDDQILSEMNVAVGRMRHEESVVLRHLPAQLADDPMAADSPGSMEDIRGYGALGFGSKLADVRAAHPSVARVSNWMSSDGWWRGDDLDRFGRRATWGEEPWLSTYRDEDIAGDFERELLFWFGKRDGLYAIDIVLSSRGFVDLNRQGAVGESLFVGFVADLVEKYGVPGEEEVTPRDFLFSEFYHSYLLRWTDADGDVLEAESHTNGEGFSVRYRWSRFYSDIEAAKRSAEQEAKERGRQAKDEY